MKEINLTLDDGRTLHAYDTGSDGKLPLFWHHGTPNLGEPPEPLFAAAAEFGMRWLSYDRPGYGGSSLHPGRSVGSAASDVASIANALGIDRFAVMGHSGGASHALACGALLPERVVGVISVSALAPFGAENLDWFEGMVASGVASLRAAAEGRETKAKHQASGSEYDPEFTRADWAALSGEWSWLGRMAGAGMRSGPWGLIDDDVAYVNPWGCDPRQIVAPTLILQGGADGIVPSSHGKWLVDRCTTAELWLSPNDGHISVLRSAAAALCWLRAHVS